MKIDELTAVITESIMANGGTQDLARKIIADIEKAAEEDKANREPAKRGKSRLHVLLLDPDGVVPKDTLVCWVVKTESEVSSDLVLGRINDAATAYNQSKKGKRIPLKSLGDAIQNCPRKFYKRENPAEKTFIQTREPISVVSTGNSLDLKS